VTYLPDTNFLIALAVADHICHETAHAFIQNRGFAVCPITQLGLLTFLSRPRKIQGKEFPPLHKPAEALRRARLVSHRKGNSFLPDDLNCAGQMPFGAVTGHRQWTDFYLAALARRHGATLLTFDEAIAVSFPEHVRTLKTPGR
jgi:toxin-antitoxin system PIN domain toxin